MGTLATINNTMYCTRASLWATLRDPEVCFVDAVLLAQTAELSRFQRRKPLNCLPQTLTIGFEYLSINISTLSIFPIQSNVGVSLQSGATPLHGG